MSTNMDPTQVPAYELPDIMQFTDGRRIADVAQWPERRKELLQLFSKHVYGVTPERPLPSDLRVQAIVREPAALTVPATRLEVTLGSATGDIPSMELMLYLPTNAKTPVPCFLGLNFGGNQSVHPDPGISLSKAWFRTNSEIGSINNRAPATSRGALSRRWPLDQILGQGYAVATVCHGDLAPDDPAEILSSGILKPGPETPPRTNESWGAIGAWAWTLSRALDYLREVPEIHPQRVAVFGHSRLGKAALWAAAQDPRFAMAISNNSGCGGASLHRHRLGENIAAITKNFPHWFAPGFKDYAHREEALPVDQHMLLALIAPRPLYVASASGDLWADPTGEFLAAREASEAYRLLGHEGLTADANMPATGHSIGERVGYHIRSGKHDLLASDWAEFLRFADRHLK